MGRQRIPNCSNFSGHEHPDKKIIYPHEDKSARSGLYNNSDHFFPIKSGILLIIFSKATLCEEFIPAEYGQNNLTCNAPSQLVRRTYGIARPRYLRSIGVTQP